MGRHTNIISGEAYRGILYRSFIPVLHRYRHTCDHMAEWSKALCLGRSLRAWVRTPLWSMYPNFLVSIPGCGEILLFCRHISQFCQNRGSFRHTRYYLSFTSKKWTVAPRAPLVERRSHNPKVASSILAGSNSLIEVLSDTPLRQSRYLVSFLNSRIYITCRQLPTL
jgi:hypothetical protein